MKDGVSLSTPCSYRGWEGSWFQCLSVMLQYTFQNTMKQTLLIPKVKKSQTAGCLLSTNQMQDKSES